MKELYNLGENVQFYKKKYNFTNKCTIQKNNVQFCKKMYNLEKWCTKTVYKKDLFCVQNATNIVQKGKVDCTKRVKNCTMREKKNKKKNLVYTID